MSHRIRATPIGLKQMNALRGKVKSSWDQALARLERDGCAAANYRLTGNAVEHICAVHLYARWRAIIAFDEPRSIWLLRLGEHNQHSELDVYAGLYRDLGVAVPSGPRTKPPCCDDAQPPIDPDVLDRVELVTRRLARRS